MNIFSSKQYCINCHERYLNSRRSNSVTCLSESLLTSREFSKQMKSNVKIIKQDPYKVFTLVQKIGKGATSVVYKALNSSTGQQIALKQIEFSKQFNKEKIFNEVALTIMSSHPNILACFSAYQHSQYSL